MTENAPTPDAVVAELRGELAHPERDADLTGLLASALALIEQQAAIFAGAPHWNCAARFDSRQGCTCWKSKLPADALAAVRVQAIRDAADVIDGQSRMLVLDEADRIEREANQ